MSCPTPIWSWCRGWQRASTGRRRWAARCPLAVVDGIVPCRSWPADALPTSAAHILLQELLLTDGRRVPYDKICLCAGARPKELPPAVFRAAGAAAEGGPGGEGEPAPAQGAELAELQRRVLTIRDTDSVARLAAQLRGARRVAVVGNGGIALEVV